MVWEFVEDDMVEAAHVEEGIDRARSVMRIPEINRTTTSGMAKMACPPECPAPARICLTRVAARLSRPSPVWLPDHSTIRSSIQAALAHLVPSTATQMDVCLLAGILDEVLKKTFRRHDEQHLRLLVQHRPHERIGLAGTGRRRHQANEALRAQQAFLHGRQAAGQCRHRVRSDNHRPCATPSRR